MTLNRGTSGQALCNDDEWLFRKPPIQSSELVSASRSKNRWTLTRPVLRRPSKIMDPSLDKIKTKIPKQVRDDNVREFQKVMTGFRTFADPEGASWITVSALTRENT